MASIIDLIPIGKENAIDGPTLTALAGLSDERMMRAAVMKARADGAVICSGTCGYFRPEKRSEIEEFIRMMQQQAISRLMSIRSARAQLKDMDGQKHLEDPDTEQ